MNTDTLSTFARHYLVAALWSSTDDIGVPLDAAYSLEDFTQEALRRANTDCEAFQRGAPELMDAYESEEYLSLESHPDAGSLDALAGHDFWLSRNGHGAGFFDRGSEPFWDVLQDMARAYGESNIEVGDDGRLYFL